MTQATPMLQSVDSLGSTPSARFFQSVLRAHLGAAIVVDKDGRIAALNATAKAKLGFKIGQYFQATCFDAEKARNDLNSSAGSSANHLFSLDLAGFEPLAVYGSRLVPEPVDLAECWVLLRFDSQANLSANFLVQSEKLERANARLREETKRRRALEAANATLAQEVHSDAKTLLLTQEGLNRALRKRVAMSADEPMAMIFLDLNEFKQINDSLGHGAGDLAIAEIGRIIRSNLRKNDLAARLGGDEFAVVLAGAHDRTQIGHFVARLHALIAEPIVYFDPTSGKLHPIQLSFSAGVAQYPRDTRDISLLSTLADRAMYQAKGLGIPTGVYDEPGSANM